MTSAAELPIAEQASLLRRIGALIYDGLLVIAIYAFTIVMIVTVTGEAAIGPFVQSFIFAEIFAFFIYFWTRYGQTLGMRAWHLSLVNVSGAPLSLAQGVLRFFVGLAGLLALGMGILWVMVDPHRRSWSDLMSDSRIRFVAPETPDKRKDK